MSKQAGLLIGFDLGTSTIKALLSDIEGSILAQASRQVKILHPERNICEQEAVPYYQDICSVIRELLEKVEDPRRVLGLSFCGATGNTLLLDKDHIPLANAINWMDTRTAGKEGELWPELEKENIYRTAGWPFSGVFPLANLGWYKLFKPELWEKTRHFTMLNDYIYYRLCRRLVVDPSKATTFYLQNQESRQWEKALLDFLDIHGNELSEIIPSGTAAGTITHDAAGETGLNEGTLVVTGSFDHPSAARSTGIFEEGDVLISAGTSWVAFAPIEQRETGLKGNMLIDPFLSPAGCWGAMFSLPAITETLNVYLRNCFTADNEASRLERFNQLAGEAEPGADGFFLNLLLEPYETMKEVLRNVPEKTAARALMEGVVLLIKNRLEQLTQLIQKPIGRIVLTGGPTKSPIWPSILSDVLARPVVIPETGQHAGAMGAVLFAGVGAGIFKDDREGYSRIRSKEKTIEPDPERTRLYKKVYQEYSARYNLKSKE